MGQRSQKLCNASAQCYSVAGRCKGMEPRGDARVRKGKAVQIEVRSGKENVKECHAV